MQRFTLSRGTARADPDAPGGHRVASDGSLTVLTVLTVFSIKLSMALIAGRSFVVSEGDLLTVLTVLTVFSRRVHGDL